MVCQVVCISFVCMPQGLALLLFECQVSGIGNAKGCGIGSIVMPRGVAYSFHRYAKGSGIGYALGHGIESIGMQGGLV